MRFIWVYFDLSETVRRQSRIFSVGVIFGSGLNFRVLTITRTGWFVAAIVGSGMLLKIIDYLLAWAKEKREQRSAKTAYEKDRPRFRIDITIVPTAHSAVP